MLLSTDLLRLVVPSELDALYEQEFLREVAENRVTGAQDLLDPFTLVIKTNVQIPRIAPALYNRQGTMC
jgi:hypothetical protein